MNNPRFWKESLWELSLADKCLLATTKIQNFPEEKLNKMIEPLDTDTEQKDHRISLTEELNQLGDKIKLLESDHDTKLDPSKWTILRVDGHRFSKFTARFKTLRSQQMIDAMIYAAQAWLLEFNGTTVYVQSDEATMAIPPVDSSVPGSVMMYNGRVSKLISLSAGFFSTKFNKYLYDDSLKGDAYFDCRCFQVSSSATDVDTSTEKTKGVSDTTEGVMDTEVILGTTPESTEKADMDVEATEETVMDTTKVSLVDVFRWRQLDAFRNGASALIVYLFQDKRMRGWSTGKKIEYIKNVTGTAYADDHLLHGTFIKKAFFLNPAGVRRTCTDQFRLSYDYIIKSPSYEWLALKCVSDVSKIK